jgi:hypothetical protein
LVNYNVKENFDEIIKINTEKKIKFIIEKEQLILEESLKSNELDEDEKIKLENDFNTLSENLMKEKNILLEDEEMKDDEMMNNTVELVETINHQEVITLQNTIKDEDIYSKKDILDYLNTQDLSYLLEKPYKGFNENEEINRILVVSHSGFISELINVIRKLKGLKIKEKNITNNTGIHVIKIYCSYCGINNVCKNVNECQTMGKIEFDFILTNECSHLSILKDA